MKKGQSPLVTGIILCLVAVYLVIYFSINGMWNAGTIMALVLILGLGSFQFVIHFVFLKDSRQNTVKKTVKQKKRL
ncbi:MAG TPA: hypothetical protein DDX91_07595 [Ruminococcaceae bacterium]|nr:hypothetical protein [Oscillospiraceae bacterium]